LTDETRQHIHDKASKLLHYFGRIMMIEVLVDAKDQEMVVEFVVSAEHKHDFVASAHNKDLLTAVDQVLDRLESQIRKYKEKVQDHHRRTPAAGEASGPATEDESDE
jgi:putative sigma-54 modulation protein